MRRERRWIRVLAFAAAIAAATVAAAADGAGRAARTRPADDAERPRATRPASDVPPEDLRAAVPASRDRDQDPRRSPGVEPQPGSRHEDGERTARAVEAAAARAGADAGLWSAVEAVRLGGAREYYRVGWYRGMRFALDDPALGAWDRERGSFAGERDPAARRAGLAEGERAARLDAGADAAADVEAMYRDLSSAPAYRPAPRPASWSAAAPFAVAPGLRDVVVGLPVADVPTLDARAAEAFRGFDRDPWSLARCASHREFLDPAWRDPEAAFARFVEERRRARTWFALRTAVERQAFRAAFDDAFARALEVEHGRSLDRAYRDGFDDGWAYGAFAVYEWNWQVGFAEGFERAARIAAVTAYERSFVPAYRAAYEDAFEDWREAVVPGIASVALIDGNDDGVFEPGESIFVEVLAVNYGGGAATVPLTVEGIRLERPGRAGVALDGRGEVRGVRPLRVAIRADAPMRADATVEVALGEARAAAPFRVGRPLELGASVAFDADVVAGRALLEVGVVNRSRRAVAGDVRLERADGLVVPALAVESLAPGASRTLAFALDRIDRAALVGGSFDVRLVVVSGDVVQDERAWRSPDRASDLASRDFARWVGSLAVAARTDPRVLDDLRVLMGRRLEADWREAVRGRGNPYKDDARRGSSSTAVGELVRVRERSGSDAAVFAVLADEIGSRADSLPGAHPRLRKWLRRLANELG